MEYDEKSQTFKSLHECAILSSVAIFDHQIDSKQNKLNELWLDKNTIGDASETALIKFFQPIEDIETTRSRFPIIQLDSKGEARISFNSINKFALSIVNYETDDSSFSLLIKVILNSFE